MARHSEPGLDHFKMQCDHIYNKKVRLLISEFGADGYWIWSCLLSEAYRTCGYYYDCNDKDELELFALDVCKKQVSLVKEVISGCVRRSLFDEGVFNVFGVLTSAHMQDFYIRATKERRKKGTTVSIKEDYWLVQIATDEVNISIIPRTKEILPGTNAKNPGTNPQSKVKESRVKKSKKETLQSGDTSGVVIGSADAPPTPKAKTFKQWDEKEFYEEIAKYTNLHPRERLRAFYDYWKEKNAAGTKMKFQLERTWETKSRLETWERNETIFGKKTHANGTHQQTSAGSAEPKLGTSDARIKTASNW